MVKQVEYIQWNIQISIRRSERIQVHGASGSISGTFIGIKQEIKIMVKNHYIRAVVK